MGHIKLEDSIQIASRELTFSTETDQKLSKVSTKILENGQLLSVETHISANGLEVNEELIRKRHQAVIRDWELLFYIYEKVKSSGHAGSLNKMGIVLMQKNLIPEAIECFTAAIRLENNFVDSYINLGKAYLRAEIYPEALEALCQAAAIAPDYADVHFLVGVASLKVRDYKKAISSLERALDLNPNHSWSNFMLANAYLQSIVDNVDTAELLPVSLRQKKILTFLQKAIDLDRLFEKPDVRQALKEVQGEKYQRAAELLEKIWEENDHREAAPVDEEFYLKFMFGGKSKDDEMINAYINHLQEQIQQHPDYPDLRNNLGVAYLIQCRNMFFKAIEQFRAALKINPSFKQANKNLKLAENEGKGFIILLRALLK